MVSEGWMVKDEEWRFNSVGIKNSEDQNYQQVFGKTVWILDHGHPHAFHIPILKGCLGQIFKTI